MASDIRSFTSCFLRLDFCPRCVARRRCVASRSASHPSRLFQLLTVLALTPSFSAISFGVSPSSCRRRASVRLSMAGHLLRMKMAGQGDASQLQTKRTEPEACMKDTRERDRISS